MLFRSWAQTADARWPDVARVPDHVGVAHLVVTRHALVRRVLADPATYRPDNALDAVTPIPVSALRVLAGHRFRLPPTLANNGGASHPAIRAIVADALHPTRVAAQRPWLTGLVQERVGRIDATLDAGGPVDLHAELAADLPLLVLARLVELPDAPVGAVKEFARAALELFWAPLDVGRQQALAAEVGRFHRVLREFAATGGGLAGSLRAAGHPPDVLVGALFFLLVAGQETTSQFLTLLLHRLAGEPAVLAGLRAGTVTVADVVEEGLRLEPPIVTWRRVAAVDTTLGGTAVPAGTSIVLWLARAGRDPAIVDAPDEFRPGQRGSRRHLAFGAGTHRCVGDQLARMEAAVVVAETAPLLDRVTVLREPWCPDNLTFRMPDAFVVRRR
ncbi:cytochrome P450 [Micromonospora peucetia]|uniref:Cytochrome P450 n=1 Tax=Micromonospora peucetia TaxID=47871 RepID=A0A1C6U0D9_9ACTN|nr:cytochrome P450 [Micromonospora peucetia]MCX4385845.1 cytochrome P450 [Micromonospora peucetia]WSA33226.1 cytochrome P450 [Micromonospora peucetia]SCL47550.1 Cytochrome P450 [Micromonospora peucetia]